MAKSSAGIENQRRAKRAVGECGDEKLLSAGMAELERERSWICVQRKWGWLQDFRRDPVLPQPMGGSGCWEPARDSSCFCKEQQYKFWNMGLLSAPVLLKDMGKGHGKLLGKLATNTIGYRATNTCVKNTENTEKKKAKTKTASVQEPQNALVLSPRRSDQLKWDCSVQTPKPAASGGTLVWKMNHQEEDHEGEEESAEAADPGNA
ncbi:hypothetical protein DUI87_22157 [Hirundo rustica rustica]|uniref:Uncharacterized protein n=1 Tax=Hirundo rustica rustica TaxID=333673 RepID=A0A3M0JJ95_HIRRU|nr:hypothetical protein DUI87_22157 [Hirundo rustica rustica]